MPLADLCVPNEVSYKQHKKILNDNQDLYIHLPIITSLTNMCLNAQCP